MEFRDKKLADNSRQFTVTTKDPLFSYFVDIPLCLIALLLLFKAILSQSKFTGAMFIFFILVWIKLKISKVKEGIILLFFFLFFFSSLILLNQLFQNNNKIESLFVIRDLGVQVKTKNYFGQETSRFIEKSKILDIIVNEGVTMQKVIFYLAIIVEGQNQMIVVFEVYFLL